MSPEDKPAQIVAHAQIVLQALVAWLLRSGVDFGQFTAAARLVFLDQAHAELTRKQHKVTDSSLSVLSGVHRQNVKEWRATKDNRQALAERVSRPSLATQILTRWRYEIEVDSTLPNAGPILGIRSEVIPFQGEKGSFEQLAKSISRSVHTRTMLNELKRLGLVEILRNEAGAEYVRLSKQVFTPSAQEQELLELLSGAVSDHLWSSVNNLTEPGADLLDQSVFATELSVESAQTLSKMANQLWQEVFQKMVGQASHLCAQDEGKDGTVRVRLGMYFTATDTKQVLGNAVLAGADKKATSPRSNARKASRSKVS